MSEDVKPDKIKKTQESLSKYIKKPPLTDKLLRKPPFRFLHDIVTAVMKETGYLEGVYFPQELNSENIKDRDAKIQFLDKLISNIKSTTGVSVTAKPSKIIAGLEVNKTLDLLIALAKAADVKLSGSKPQEKTATTKSSGQTREDKKSNRATSKEDKDGGKKKREESRGRDKDAKKKLEPRAGAKAVSDKRKQPESRDRDVAKQEKRSEVESLKKSEVESLKKSEDNRTVEDSQTLDGTVDVAGKDSVKDKVMENGDSPVKRQPSHKDKQADEATRSSAKVRRASGERRGSSRLNGSDNGPLTLDDRAASTDKSLSLGKESTATPSESSVKSEDRSASRDAPVPQGHPVRAALEDIVQNSTDSLSNSNLSSDPSDKHLNSHPSPPINGEGGVTLPPGNHERRGNRVSSVNSRMERYLSAKSSEAAAAAVKHTPSNEESATASRQPVNDDQHPSSVAKPVKMKRPQSAKMRPPSSRQRKVEEKAAGENDGQVVLGQGDSVDVMGSAPISAPSAKGRRMLSGRPMSSRPGAPKPKDRGQISTSQPSSSSEEVKPIALIEDNKEIDDDSENMVVVEKEIELDQLDDRGGDEVLLDSKLDESNQGALVSQILETKKELEETNRGRWSNQPSIKRSNLDIDWEARSRSRRDAVSKEVRSLREGIQTVTRSSNPLGKLFDFLQEDVETMQSELQHWSDTASRLQKDIQLQTKQMEDLLSPLRKQLSELDLLIEHEQDSIKRVKSNIHLNSVKLDNLLRINSNP